MTRSRNPRFAVALLEALGADPVMVGDLVEEFETRGSRLWLWRQVLGTVPVLLLGHAARPEPHRAKTVNLAVTPRGSVVGGLGLLSMAALMTVVLPAAWWLVAIGAVGGLLLGAVLIAVSRQHARRSTSAGKTLGL